MKNYNQKNIKWKQNFQIIKNDVLFLNSKNMKNNCKFIEGKLRKKKKRF